MDLSDRLLIVGTSHVSNDSIKEVKKSFETFKPDIIAVELDRARLNAFESKKKGSRLHIRSALKVGISGFIFALIGGFIQRKIGKKLNIEPGRDMYEAVQLGLNNNKKVALVDRNISVTLKQFSKKVSFREKFRMVKDILLAPFQRKKDKLKFDISKVPSDSIIDTVINELEVRYPQTFEVLLNSRNVIMANRVKGIAEKVPDAKIMLVVGAAHKKGVSKLLFKQSGE